jgi:hypothetical protein
MGAQVGLENFPAPAELTWASSDGKYHSAVVDIGAIFSDQVFYHSVANDDIFRIEPSPEILIVVEDRTVRVYLKSFVHLKHEYLSGIRRVGYRLEASLAYEKIY